MAKTVSKDIPETLKHFDELPDSAAVDIEIVAALTGAGSRVTVYRWIKNGRLPKGHLAGPNSRRWTVGEIRAAMAATRSVAVAA